MGVSIPYGGPFAYHGRGGEAAGRSRSSPALSTTTDGPSAMDAKTQRALHSLADLLLTGPAGTPQGAGEFDDTLQFPHGTRGDSRPVRRQVELLLAGRVPGYAASWLSQYSAEQTRPSVLLRFGSGGAELEVYGPTPEQLHCADEHSDFAGVLQRLASCGPRLAIAPIDLSPQELSHRASQIERWTILTSADDQALMACYQVLKVLVTQGEPIGPTEGVGLVFVGCDEVTAKAAADRIAPVAQQFLGLQLELAGVIRRIEPITDRVRMRFEGNDLWPAIAGTLRLDEVERSSPADPRPLVSQEEIEALRQESPEPAHLHDSGLGERGSQLVDYLPGARLLPARCPRHPPVELAADQAGQIHLLMRCESEPVEQRVMQLLEARLWALEHRQLLALASPGQRLDPVVEPVAHLFTDHLGAATGLALAGPPNARLLRLHLLKTVTVGGRTHYVHEELV